MRPAPVLLLAIALPACPGRRPEPASPPRGHQPAPAMKPATGYVVVPTTAWFRTAPDDGAVKARRGVIPPDSCAVGMVEPMWVMRRVAEVGDWVAVENLQSIEGRAHCYGGDSWPLDHLRLRLWVKRDELAEVTRREVRVDYPDGTGFTLSAGVQVTPAEGGYLVAVDGNRMVLEVPPDVIGHSYAAPSAHLNADHTESPDDPIPPDHVLVGGKTIQLQSVQEAVGLLFDRSDGRKMAAYSMRCSELVSNPVDSPGMMFGCGHYGTIGRDFDTLDAGTPLTWLDGSPAGEVIDQTELYWAADSPDQRTCFRVPLRTTAELENDREPDAEQTFTLCAGEP